MASNSKTPSRQTSGSGARARGQSDDEASAARQALPPLKMPTPEQVGLGSKQRNADVDWTGVGRRLRSLEISTFHSQKLDGGFRFTCVVPTAGGERRKIEADGLTEAEAIDLALGRAEKIR